MRDMGLENVANVEMLPVPMLPMANWALELDIVCGNDDICEQLAFMNNEVIG